MLTFTVSGKPLPKQRPRTVRTKNGKSRTYTPKKTLDAEERIRMIAWAEMQKNKVKKFTDPVGVAISFIGANPSADIDNLMKTVLDGMNGTVFEDDRQVVDCQISKRNTKLNPRTVVSVWSAK